MKERTTSGPLLSRRFRLVLLHLAEEARRDLDSLAGRTMRSIHSLRTRMKNLRALLHLVKTRIPKPARKAVATLAGALKDAFSEQRDAHIIATLRAEFPGLRVTAAKGGVAPQYAKRNTKAKADASRLIRMVSRLRLSGLTWADVISGYVQSYRCGRKAMQACERKQTPKSFHALRRPVKDLFYQSQALQPIEGMKDRRHRTDRLADQLGDLHDLHTLHVAVKKSCPEDALKPVAKKQHRLRPAIFKAAAKLFHERPREIERALERCVKFHPAITAQAVRQT